jgi:hypothetical protein
LSTTAIVGGEQPSIWRSPAELDRIDRVGPPERLRLLLLLLLLLLALLVLRLMPLLLPCRRGMVRPIIESGRALGVAVDGEEEGEV